MIPFSLIIIFNFILTQNYIKHNNTGPESFIRTESATVIVQNVKHAQSLLEIYTSEAVNGVFVFD